LGSNVRVHYLNYPPAVVALGDVGKVVTGKVLVEGVLAAKVVLVGHAHPVLARLACHHEVAVVVKSTAAAAGLAVTVVEHNDLVNLILASLEFRDSNLTLRFGI